MAFKDKKIINIPAGAEPKQGAEDFVVHVMPKEFKGRAAAVKQVAKPLKPAPVPIPVKKPLTKLQSKKIPAKKKGRRSTVILIVVGILVLSIFALAAWFVLNGLNETLIEEDVGGESSSPVEIEEIVVQEPEITSPTPGLDTDSDGLTDEEESLYGTDYRNPDTDADTFLDGNEVFHRYDPLGFSPSTLLDTGSVSIYSSAETDNSFAMHYPKTWLVQSVYDPGTDITSEVTFSSQTTSRIILLVKVKDKEESFETWYRENALDDVNYSVLLPKLSKGGFAGYMSSDKLVTYLDLDERVFIFQYDVGEEKTIQFLQTFQMMVNSLEFDS